MKTVLPSDVKCGTSSAFRKRPAGSLDNWLFNFVLVFVLAIDPVFAQMDHAKPILVAKAQYYQETGKEGMPGEPMIIQHPDGSLYLGGFVFPKMVVLYHSRDSGLTWQAMDLHNDNAPEWGNSDIDLAITPSGSVHMVAMRWEEDQGAGISVVSGSAVSNTWAWKRISEVPGDDRPWIRATPDGTLHLVWNNRDGIQYARSMDNGQSWDRRLPIYPEGTSSHFAAGPHGELAVRITPKSRTGTPEDPKKDLIAISFNGGNEWTLNLAPGDRSSKAIHRHVEPLGFDARGALYYLWSEVNSLWLARSIDMGKSWHVENIYASEDRVFYPYIAVRDAGEIGLTWMEGWYETQRCFAGRISFDPKANAFLTLQTRPLFWESMVTFLKGSLAASGFIDPPRIIPVKGAGEYEPVIFLQNGEMAVATEVYNAVDHRFGFRTHILDYASMKMSPFSTLGIIGTSTDNGWDSSLMMQSSDAGPAIWELEAVLKKGEVKFRADDSWEHNWGGNTFPEGQAIFYGSNIQIPLSGKYRITIDLNTFRYRFERLGD